MVVTTENSAKFLSKASCVRNVSICFQKYANINYRFTQAFAYGILAGIKKLTISFLKGNIKYAKGYASTVFSLLKQSKAVIQVRKQTKTKFTPVIFKP